MSDQFNDVLAAIDAETAKCICGRPVPKDGPSLDYCSEDCQAHWLGSRELPRRPVDRYTMGRATYHNPPSMSMRVPIRNGAREAEADWVEISGLVALTVGFDAGASRARIERERQLHALRVLVDEQADRYLEECNGDPAQAIYFAQNGIAPSTIRLARALGIDLWQLRVMADSIPGRADDALRWAAEVSAQSEPDPPLTGDDFRIRALEHQQNRGTGPQPGRRIPPRDLRR